MSRSSSPQADRHSHRPRRRGTPTSASQPTQPAAPILLQLPDLSHLAANPGGTPRVTPAVTPPPAPPLDEGLDLASIDATLGGTIGLQEPPAESASRQDPEREHDEAIASDEETSEIRQRRRKRREKQETATPLWGTTSGQVTIAGGAVVFVVILAALLFSGGDADEPGDVWSEPAAISEAESGNNFVQVEAPADEPASTPFAPPEEVGEPLSATELAAQQLQAASRLAAESVEVRQATVQSERISPEEVAGSAFAQTGADAYSTPPQNGGGGIDTDPYGAARHQNVQPAAARQESTGQYATANAPYVTPSSPRVAQRQQIWNPNQPASDASTRGSDTYGSGSTTQANPPYVQPSQHMINNQYSYPSAR